MPKTNRGYWVPKLEANRKRDLETVRELERGEWKVLRIWEHDLKTSAGMAEQVRNVCNSVRANLLH